MRIDPRTGGAVPALSGEEILAYDPGLRALADLEVIDFGRYPGPHMNPEKMFDLSELLARNWPGPRLRARWSHTVPTRSRRRRI